MKELFYEEFYKLFHKRGTWYTPLILFGAMLVVGIMARSSSFAEWYIIGSFAGTEWLLIIMIVVCATTISMEYEYGTIGHLVVKDKSKIKIFLAKFLLIIIYDIYLHFLAFIFTFPIKWLIYGSKYKFTEIYNYGQPLWHNLITECLIDLLGSAIIVGIIFLLSCAAKNSAIAIASGITIIFIGQGISNMLIKSVGKGIPLVKWNPFNMLNMANE